MKSEIGNLIAKNRERLKMTQDQYGRKYNVSGPAIFKFEKGYVKPSLDLWLAMSADMDLTEQKAVLMWVRAKLPRKYQGFVDVEVTPSVVEEESAAYGKQKAAASRSKMKDPEKLRKAIIADRTAPKGLKLLLKDNDLWALYRPEVDELELLRDLFGELGEGSKASYREALRLVREFGSGN